MIQQKICKGQGKAKDYEGCGSLTDVKIRKFGLCPSCQWDWMRTNERGKIYYHKQFIPKTKKVSEKRRKELTRKQKTELMSVTEYRSKKLQPVINKIARLIDFGTPCIATNSFEGKMAGGHYISVGSNATTSLNLHNIHIQSFHSNSWKGGDDKRYKQGLIDRYGLDYFEFVDGLKRTPALHLTKDDLIEIRKNAMQIKLTLERDYKCTTPMGKKARIYMRNHINNELGIYPKEFSNYQSKLKEL